jgi:hypothetical protein
MRASADVEDRAAGERGRFVTGGCGLEHAYHMVLDRLDLPGKRVTFGHCPLQRGFHLLQGSGCRAQALLEPLAPRELLSELPVDLRDHASERLDFAAGRVVAGLVVERMLGLADERLVEPANRRVARGESVAQLLLLPVELLDQRAVLFLELPQPPNVRPVGGADEVREHVHVPECLLHDRIARNRMAQQCPIGTWDIAALDRRVPHPAQRRFVLGFCILLDRQLVTLVERFLQQPCAGFPAPGQHDPHDVKVVLIGSLGSGHLQPDEDAAQFGVRQASSDDRAVKRIRQIPYLAAFGGLRERSVGDYRRLEDEVRPAIERCHRGKALPARRLAGSAGRREEDTQQASLYSSKYSEYGQQSPR